MAWVNGVGIGIGFQLLAGGGVVPPLDGFLLLETGDEILLEDGSGDLLLEG